MAKRQYKARIADALLERKLRGMGAVLIEGPKWCGKTTTAEQQAKSVIFMDDPASRKANLEAADIAPNLILNGPTPRLIDEWQIAPQLWTLSDLLWITVMRMANLSSPARLFL